MTVSIGGQWTAHELLAAHPLLETVTVCVPDGTGRLLGKTVRPTDFIAATERGLPMPDFFLATDAQGRVIPDLPATNEAIGFPNAVLLPDLSTFREAPWDSAGAIVLCDATDSAGAILDLSARAVLRRQVDLLAEHGLRARVATELEFYLYRGSAAEMARTGYRHLVPVHHRQGDHDLLAADAYGDIFSDIRHAMEVLGTEVVASHGEGGLGQVELTFDHADPMAVADRHTLFKHVVKTVGRQRGVAPTFMAKVDAAQPGSSCHIHCSLWGEDSAPVFSGGGTTLSSTAASFVAGLLRYAGEFALLHAPYPNSFARLQPGSWAPTAATWAYDNRTVLARVLGDGPSLRVEFRLPGADVSPHFSLAGLLAAGRLGIEQGLVLGAPTQGSGYADRAGDGLPRSLDAAVAAFAGSDAARAAFGPAVQSYLLARGRHELDEKLNAVSTWDRARLFDPA